MDVIRRTSDAVVSRWDDALAPGATVELGEQDRAVLTWSGQVLGVLGPGRSELSPAAVPGLGDAVSGNDLEAELWFVRVEPYPLRFEARAQVQGPQGPAQVAAAGVAMIAIDDPSAVARACLDAEPDAFLQQVAAALQAVVQARLASTPPAHLDALASAGLAVIAADANPKLQSLGARVSRVSSLQLHLDPALAPPQQAAPPPAAASAAGSCPACGAPNQAGRFCTACGQSLARPGVCGSCGAPLTPGAAFCTGCGARV